MKTLWALIAWAASGLFCNLMASYERGWKSHPPWMYAIMLVVWPWAVYIVIRNRRRKSK
jgi:FtsH-binding integral membrane protein